MIIIIIILLAVVVVVDEALMAMLTGCFWPHDSPLAHVPSEPRCAGAA
jgi:hypothetical protein